MLFVFPDNITKYIPFSTCIPLAGDKNDNWSEIRYGRNHLGAWKVACASTPLAEKEEGDDQQTRINCRFSSSSVDIFGEEKEL